MRLKTLIFYFNNRNYSYLLYRSVEDEKNSKKSAESLRKEIT